MNHVAWETAVPEAITSEARAEFLQALDRSIQASLIGRWWGAIAAGIGWLTRRSRPAPFWAAVLGSVMLTLGLSFGVALLLGEGFAWRPPYTWQLVAWVGYTAVFCLVMQHQYDHSVSALSTTVTEHTRSSRNFLSLGRFIRKLSFWPLQLLVTLAYGVLCGFLGTYFVYMVQGQGFLVSTTLLYGIDFFQIGMYLLFLLIFAAVFRRLGMLDLDVYDSNPVDSPVIQRVYHSSRDLLLAVAALGALFILLVGVLVPNAFSAVLVIALLLLGWGPVIALFIITHQTIAQIISEAKTRKLAKIQELVSQAELQGDINEKETMEALNRLLDYYDRLRDTPNSMLNLSSLSSLVASLLLPLVAIILGNLNVLASLFGLRPPP